MTATRLKVKGGAILRGEVKASGAKNAILPLLAACIMFRGETRLLNIPHMGDVAIMLRMLKALNIRAEYLFQEDVHILNTKKIRHIAPYELVTSMRASFFVAGPLLAMTGYAKVPLPGGCSIGARPVDIHLKGFKAMGAKIEIEHGFVDMKVKKLLSNFIPLSFPSVGATENLMMAACLTEGETVIDNAAKEPEIIDLANFLICAGAKIEGAGTSRLHIQGVQSLSGVKDYHVIPDRVEVATLLIAAAITRGDVTVLNAKKEHISSLLDILTRMGVKLDYKPEGIRAYVDGPLVPVDVVTEPYPGFPTDFQAQLMALLVTIPGESKIQEAIFENRFMHVPELVRLGADITIDKNYAIINGGNALSGAEVKITDLRAGAAMLLAGLVAKGETSVYGLHHLRRGYYDFEGKLKSLGATFIV
jgi:UDP-N-acetylglucosamine 1-carboxyvinyltransferase